MHASAFHFNPGLRGAVGRHPLLGRDDGRWFQTRAPAVLHKNLRRLPVRRYPYWDRLRYVWCRSSELIARLMMATSVHANTEGDVKVTAEDQDMINKFARQNAKLDEVTEELKQLEKELRNHEDAAEEILMAEDDVPIPYQLGEIFVSLDSEEAQQMIKQAQERKKTQVAALQQDAQAIREVMGDLKSLLYGKFGNNINLEPDDS